MDAKGDRKGAPLVGVKLDNCNEGQREGDEDRLDARPGKVDPLADRRRRLLGAAHEM